MEEKEEIEPRLLQVSDITAEKEESIYRREQNKIFRQQVRKILNEPDENGKTKMELIANRFVNVLINEEQTKYFLKGVELLCKLFGDFEPQQTTIIAEKEVDMNKIKTIKNLLDNQE